MSKILNGNKIDMGTCYYPEHWDKSMWEEDIDRMLELPPYGVLVVKF
ncbi:hypothetical protein [Butyrivibrio sp. MC2021]|nr:hypothetical protein [Butyrivibrio sp. MC2021]